MHTKKAVYNILSQTAYEVVALICGLILPRLILSYFGSNYNGIVSSITQFLDYISILTLGLSGSTRVALYKAKANQNVIESVSSILKATDMFMDRIGKYFILYAVLLTFIYPYIIHSNVSSLEISLLVIIISMSVYCQYVYGFSYKTFLMADQSIYIYNCIQICCKLFSTIVACSLIYLGCSIHIVELGIVCSLMAAPVFLKYYVRKKYSLIDDVPPDYNALKGRRDVMAHSIANTIYSYTGIFLFTILTNASTISVYIVYSLVFNSLKKIQNIFTVGLEAVLGEHWARNDLRAFNEIFDKIEFFIFLLTSIIISSTITLIIPFVCLYTKGINDVNYIIPEYAFLATVAEAFFCVRTPYLIAVQAAGKYKETRNGAFYESGLNLLVSIIGIVKYGILGIALGNIVANLFRTFQYVCFLSNNMLNRRITVFAKKLSWMSFNIFVVEKTVYCFILDGIRITDWKDWMFYATFITICGFVITNLSAIVFYRKNYIDIMSYIFNKYKTRLQKNNK